ncbi:membrane protein [Streptomyces caatingaensis]|uniref:Membrane protein n=1 Tax=Streptomyces caatingaensis TaxID=1678637 RepID=A0A0K9XI01_9ACTN|nr:DUF2752 domain-containing protein [Streptomyces caatingaensis]KNB52661.1 membrane protein [Streptomyces caatingaensis]
MRRLGAPLGVAGLVAAGAVLVGVVDPYVPGHYPACPLLRRTGVYCPGCGGLRGLHALVHGDLAAAVHANALAVVGYAVFVPLWVLWCVRAARHGGGLPLRVTRGRGWALTAVVLAFTVVRNLPCGAALAP